LGSFTPVFVVSFWARLFTRYCSSCRSFFFAPPLESVVCVIINHHLFMNIPSFPAPNRIMQALRASKKCLHFFDVFLRLRPSDVPFVGHEVASKESFSPYTPPKMTITASIPPAPASS